MYFTHFLHAELKEYSPLGLFRNDYYAFCNVYGISPHSQLLPLEKPEPLLETLLPSVTLSKILGQDATQDKGKPRDLGVIPMPKPDGELHKPVYYDFSICDNVTIRFQALSQRDVLPMYRALRVSTHIRVLTLVGANLSRQMIQELAYALVHSCVAELRLEYNPLRESLETEEDAYGTGHVDASMEEVSGKTRRGRSPWALFCGLYSPLQSLSLRFNELTCEDCADMAMTLAFNTHLKLLDLSHNHIGDEGVDKLSFGLRENKSLVSLSLASNIFTSTSLPNLLQSFRKSIHIQGDAVKQRTDFECEASNTLLSDAAFLSDRYGEEVQSYLAKLLKAFCVTDPYSESSLARKSSSMMDMKKGKKDKSAETPQIFPAALFFNPFVPPKQPPWHDAVQHESSVTAGNMCSSYVDYETAESASSFVSSSATTSSLNINGNTRLNCLDLSGNARLGLESVPTIISFLAPHSLLQQYYLFKSASKDAEIQEAADSIAEATSLESDFVQTPGKPPKHSAAGVLTPPPKGGAPPKAKSAGSRVGSAVISKKNDSANKGGPSKNKSAAEDQHNHTHPSNAMGSIENLFQYAPTNIRVFGLYKSLGDVAFSDILQSNQSTGLHNLSLFLKDVNDRLLARFRLGLTVDDIRNFEPLTLDQNLFCDLEQEKCSVFDTYYQRLKQSNLVQDIEPSGDDLDANSIRMHKLWLQCHNISLDAIELWGIGKYSSVSRLTEEAEFRNNALHNLLRLFSSFLPCNVSLLI